jgi:putative protein-disulfide isomerase
MNEPVLWYFADPMCSWCWGFCPVVEAIRERYGERMKIALILGGLRPGTTTPMTATQRAEILHHWHAVNERTGQVFRFDDAMPEGFVYDTEPPSRAVVAVGSLAPDRTFAMMKRVQAAFYAGARDITRREVLAGIAGELGIATEEFVAAFDSDDAKSRTRAHFEQARAWGVRGFPTTVLQTDTGYSLLASGWRPLKQMEREIERRLG